MQSGLLSATVKQAGRVVYLTKGHVLAADSDDIIQVKTHAIDVYSFNSETNKIELESSAPVQKSIINAHIVTNPSWETQRIAYISSDFSFSLLWFENDEITSLTSTELRHEGIKPTKNAPIIASGGKYIFVSLYPTSLFLITPGETLTVKEIHFSNFVPLKMHCIGNSLFVSNNNQKLLEIKLDSFENSTIGYNDSITKEIAELQGKNIYFNNENICAFESTILKIYTFDNTKLNEKEIINTKSEQIPLFVTLFENSYILGYNTNIVYKTTQENQSAASFPINAIFINNNYILTHLKYNPPTLIEVETKTQTATTQDPSFFITSAKSRHSVKNTESLLSAHGSPSTISVYGLGVQFEETTSAVAQAERAFTVDNSLVITGEGFSQCITSNPIPYLKTDIRTKAASNGIQVTENSIISKDSALENIQVQHATISGNKVAISTPSTSIVKIYEIDKSINEIREIDVGGETSCLFLDNDNMFVSTWSNNSIVAYNISNGEIKATFSSPITSPFVVRSILLSQEILWVGTSSGYIFTASFKNDKFDNVKFTRCGLSPINLNLLHKRSGVFVAGEKPGVAVINDDVIDFFPCGIAPCVSAHDFQDFIVIIREKSYSLGTLNDEKVIEISRMNLEGEVRSISILDDQTIAVLSIEKNYFVLSFFNGINFALQCSHKKLLRSEANTLIPNSMTTFSINNHYYVVVALGIKETSKGQALFFEFAENVSEITKLDFEFDATAVSFSNKKVVVAAGSSLHVINVSQDSAGALTLNPENKKDGMMLAVEMKSKDGMFLVSDIFKSAAVYDGKVSPINLLKVDYNSKQLNCAEFCDDGVIACDINGGVFYLKDSEEKALLTHSLFSFGESISSIIPWKPLNLPENILETFAVTTICGSIYLLSRAKKEIVTKLKEKMDEEAISAAAVIPYFCNESAANYACVDNVEEATEEESKIIEWIQKTTIEYL